MAFDDRLPVAARIGEPVHVGPMTRSVRPGCGRKMLRPQAFPSILALRGVKGSLRGTPLHFARP